MLTVMYLFLAGCLGVSNSQYIYNTEFNNTLGLYYERLTPLQAVAGIWRATIFLDIEQPKDFLTILNNQLVKLNDRCMAMMNFSCDKSFGFSRITKRIQVARRTKDTLTETISTLRNYSKFRTYKQIPATVTRKKRNMPWFGFIGKIAKPVAGILNYEDGERYEQAIDNLQQEQYNISRLMGEQTHLIRSELHKIHELSIQREIEVNIMHQTLKQYKESITKINKDLIFAKFETLALATSLKVENSVEEYQAGLEEILSAIQAAQEGTLHLSLISREQIISMAREIQEATPGLEFPVHVSQINVIDFMHLSKVSMRVQGKRIFIVVDIPILERDVYDLYKLHQVPIPQTEQPKGDRAYILPKTKYLALEADNKRYIYLDDDTLQSCKMNNNKYICYLNQPIYDSTLLPSCEVNLLRKPSLAILRTCNIRLSTNHQPYWTSMVSLGGWLYALREPETAQLICSKRQRKDLILKGSGILQISPNCIVRTDSVTLTALQIFKDPTEYIYKPQINLNISELSPGLAEYHLTAMDMTEPAKNFTLSPIWDSEKTDIALADLERQWNSLREHSIKLH